jgi:hypothetical protein
MRALIVGIVVVLGLSGCASDGGAGPSSDAGVVEDGAACTATLLERAAADWLFLVDHSGSWTRRADRWAGLGDALGSFLDEEQTAASAMTAFPRQAGTPAECTASEYEALDLGWGASPAAIKTAVAALSLAGGSTLGPALSGAAVAARAHQAVDHRRATAIVLLTDATPREDETCQSSQWDAVADIARAAFDQGRGDGVSVHVISVMGVAVDPNHLPLVGGIADAGGGFAAFVNGSRDDVARSGLTGLRNIRQRMTTCTLIVPPGVHPEQLEIVFPDGTIERASRVANAGACAGASFYVDDPASPTRATLCSGSPVGGFCELVSLRTQSAGQPTVRALCPPEG